jgi:hypothetical protein
MSEADKSELRSRASKAGHELAHVLKKITKSVR